MSVEITKSDDGAEHLLFWCNGCETHHSAVVKNGTSPYWEGKPGPWGFNGDLNKPTISPSLKVTYHDGRVCHLWLRAGKVEYLSDSYHHLAGKTVDVEPPQ